MGKLGCPKTNVMNYHYLHNNLEVCGSHPIHSVNLKSSTDIMTLHRNKYVFSFAQPERISDAHFL